jgi:hypothetical protein
MTPPALRFTATSAPLRTGPCAHLKHDPAATKTSSRSAGTKHSHRGDPPGRGCPLTVSTALLQLTNAVAFSAAERVLLHSALRRGQCRGTTGAHPGKAAMPSHSPAAILKTLPDAPSALSRPPHLRINGEPAMMTLARSVGRQNAHEVVHPAEHRRRHPGNHPARCSLPPQARPKPSDQTQIERLLDPSVPTGLSADITVKPVHAPATGSTATWSHSGACYRSSAMLNDVPLLGRMTRPPVTGTRVRSTSTVSGAAPWMTR